MDAPTDVAAVRAHFRNDAIPILRHPLAPGSASPRSTHRLGLRGYVPGPTPRCDGSCRTGGVGFPRSGSGESQ